MVEKSSADCGRVARISFHGAEYAERKSPVGRRSRLLVSFRSKTPVFDEFGTKFARLRRIKRGFDAYTHILDGPMEAKQMMQPQGVSLQAREGEVSEKVCVRCMTRGAFRSRRFVSGP